MSTYYAIFCTDCREQVNFVSRGERFSWMGQRAMDDVTEFMGRHVEHIGALRVISEDDPRWYGGADEEDIIRGY
jgi:hypothetical protein